MDSINKLTEIFSHFPGIGPRQAKRFVYYLLGQNEFINKQIAELIVEIKKEISACALCNRFFYKKQDGTVCNICGSPNRDTKRLMIVAKDIDLENIEKSGSYDGYYFILGNLLPILDKKPEEKIRQKELFSRLKKMPEVDEIIIALSANVEGDHTTEYLKQVLSSMSKEKNIKISVLGRGLSTGTELEYSDSDTIKNAMRHRE